MNTLYIVTWAILSNSTGWDREIKQAASLHAVCALLKDHEEAVVYRVSPTYDKENNFDSLKLMPVLVECESTEKRRKDK